ncbi:MAG: SUMF1/EgtB/PvdO family nonheme iron enzyme, partial [Planctomycetes bacterium]|nr:SUMF1/EgtB/PvdO family nonheme iron enzyme [Planctomycetota bacterium]
FPVLPDTFSEDDRIGYGVYARGLDMMIRSVDATGSFTIGIYGEWGQGKTSMLRQIKKSLDAHEGNPDVPVLTSWFNPWQFHGEEHLIVPFFHSVVNDLKKFKDDGNIGEDSNKWEKFNKFFKKMASVPVALAYGMSAEVKVPLLLKSKFDISKFIDELRKSSGDVSQIENDKYRECIEEHESLYYGLIENLKEVSEGIGMKIVVFVDDLDRCLPEKAVQLLEGLKVLLDIPGFVFVIGVAREVIERGIRVHYRELYANLSGDLPKIERDYLDKIIQFPFTLPPVDPVAFRKHIIEDQMKDLKEAVPYLDTILETLGKNPRTVKRFVNTVSFYLWVAKEKQPDAEDAFQTELLIKTCLIAFELPSLYKQLGQYPHHLKMIEKILKDVEKESVGQDIDNKFSKIDKKKRGIPEVDQWLETNYIRKLSAILRCEGERNDKGFLEDDIVARYIGMLTPTITSMDESKDDALLSRLSFSGAVKNRMVRITGGTFIMGDDKTGTVDVKVDDFEMDKFPVAQSLYREIMGENPSRFEGDDKPVEMVTWFDAVDFCNRLSEKNGLDPVYKKEGNRVTWDEKRSGYRLPTEAEWEYACRGGTTGDRYGDLDDIAWYGQNSDDSTQPVGQKKENDYGLYDMLGNVWEWCWDRYKKGYDKENVDNPKDPDGGSDRVVRGGGWSIVAGYCRSAIRISYGPDLRLFIVGFRLSRSVSLGP